MMKITLLLFLFGAATVMGAKFLCPGDGKLFECFEWYPTYRACLVDRRGQNAHVTCSKCMVKWEFCRSNEKFEESDYPVRHCGKDYKSTPCTKANSVPPKYMKKDKL